MLTEIGKDGAWVGINPVSNILGPLFDSESGVSLKSISKLSVSSQIERVFLYGVVSSPSLLLFIDAELS